MLIASRHISPSRIASSGISLILLLWSLSGCATIPKFQVHGTLADQYVSTTVDSEISQYYLEHYLHDDRINAEYDDEIDKALAIWNQLPLDRGALAKLTDRFSPDFSALYFVSRLYEDPVNRRAQQAFHAHLAAIRRGGKKEMLRAAQRFESYLVAFVPGYGYKSDPETGADFALQRRIMTRAGFRTVLIETEEVGTVEANASILANEIPRLATRYEKIILVSTSKGGPEVALAIGELIRPNQLHAVKAWISIGGLLRGSPEADRALTWPRSWWASIVFFFGGVPKDTVRSLHTEKRREVFARLDFPPHILMLQYVGIPLSGQIEEYVEGRYRTLRDLGPNDGLTLLADELIEGGIVVTDIGLDHFYADPEIDLKTFALAQVVMDELGRRERAGRQREKGEAR